MSTGVPRVIAPRGEGPDVAWAKVQLCRECAKDNDAKIAARARSFRLSDRIPRCDLIWLLPCYRQGGVSRPR